VSPERRRRCLELPRLRALIKQIWEGNGGGGAALGGLRVFLALPVATAGFAASFVLAPVWRSRGRNLRSFGAGEAGKEAGAGAAARVSKRVGGGPAGLHTGLFGIMVFCSHKYSLHSKL